MRLWFSETLMGGITQALFTLRGASCCPQAWGAAASAWAGLAPWGDTVLPETPRLRAGLGCQGSGQGVHSRVHGAGTPRWGWGWVWGNAESTQLPQELCQCSLPPRCGGGGCPAGLTRKGRPTNGPGGALGMGCAPQDPGEGGYLGRQHPPWPVPHVTVTTRMWQRGLGAQGSVWAASVTLGDRAGVLGAVRGDWGWKQGEQEFWWAAGGSGSCGGKEGLWGCVGPRSGIWGDCGGDCGSWGWGRGRDLHAATDPQLCASLVLGPGTGAVPSPRREHIWAVPALRPHLCPAVPAPLAAGGSLEPQGPCVPCWGTGTGAAGLAVPGSPGGRVGRGALSQPHGVGRTRGWF